MKYEIPTADVILFDDADIITTSGGETTVDDNRDPYRSDKFIWF